MKHGKSLRILKFMKWGLYTPFSIHYLFIIHFLTECWFFYIIIYVKLIIYYICQGFLNGD